MIANSIPQTATIERDKAMLQVDYAGAPGFAPVEGTALQYATNTATPVVMVNPTSYYACQGGVWFVSPEPDRAVGGGDLGAGIDLHHPGQQPDSLCDLLLRLWSDAELCLCGLHPRLHGDGGGARGRGGLWQRLLLSAGGGGRDVRGLRADVWVWLGHGGGFWGRVCVWLLRGLGLWLLVPAVLGLLWLGVALWVRL